MNSTDLIPDNKHYDIGYVADGRMFSYAHQIHNALSFSPKTILEVGAGPGIVTVALRQLGIQVSTLDLEPTNKPDIQASVLDIPLEDNSVDIFICCQVLEHLPKEDLKLALKELSRVSRAGGVLSLPDISPCYYAKIKLPILPRMHLEMSRNPLRPPKMPPNNRFENIGHFWEIGVEGADINFVKSNIASAGLKLTRDWRVPEYVWHHFFLMSK